MELLTNFFIVISTILIDQSLSFFLPYNYTYQSVVIVSSLFLIVFIYLLLKLQQNEYLFGFSIGLYYSVIYGHYSFAYPIIFLLFSYIIKKFYKFNLKKTSEYFLLFISTTFLYYLFVYLWMYIGNKTNISILSFVQYRLLPSVLINSIYSLIAAKLIKRNI